MTTSDLPLIAFDCETYLMGAGAVAPKVVCLSMAPGSDPDGRSRLFGNADDLYSAALRLFAHAAEEECLLVAHNLAFDFSVIHESYPEDELRAAMWDAAEAGTLRCTRIREKLLNLSTHGKLNLIELPDGSSQKIRYNLAVLVKDYFGVDLSEEKDAEDSWRLNYSILDGDHAEDYPEEAADYAREDSVWAVKVFEQQEERVESERGPASLNTDKFHTAVDCALRMMTVRGLCVSHVNVEMIEKKIDQQLTEEHLKPLYDAKILEPPQPPRPYANGAVDEDGLPKMTAAKPAKLNTQQLRDLVSIVAYSQDYELRKTPGGEISTDNATLEELAPHNELLALYQERQKWHKIKTAFLPVLREAESIHPDFDVLKETGRTSSFGSSLYPSMNIQQIPNLVRPCFKARAGFYLCSIDYSAIELVSLAQKCYSLFGTSKLRDLINSGGDAHGYLGAQLALHFHEDFRALCEREEIGDDRDQVYRAFKKCENSDSPEVVEFYDKFRTFAKPTGLGYPGGLGAETFVQFAKAVYGIEISVEDAKMMKEIWMSTFPEMRRYFQWVNEQTDPQNADGYAYSTPFGMYRAGASYCAASNGAGLQSPTGEGAKLAVFRVAKECYHPDGQLVGSFPLAFIHDEILLEVPRDRAHEHALIASEIMVDAMAVVMTDVKVRTERALMIHWDKRAKPVWKAGQLVPWKPPMAR